MVGFIPPFVGKIWGRISSMPRLFDDQGTPNAVSIGRVQSEGKAGA